VYLQETCNTAFMTDIKQIVSAIGVSQIAVEVGVTNASVYNAIYDGKFPAAWYRAVTDLGKKNSQEVPFDLFRWKTAKEE